MTEQTVKQYTTQQVQDGYWTNAKGVMTPVSIVKEIDIERDGLVGELVDKAVALNKLLADFKFKAFADIQAFVDLSAEKYGAKKGGAKGNVTLFTFDGRFKIQRAMADNIKFDERLQAAKTLIDECLTEWMKDARPEVHALISEAFDTDAEGNIKTGRVLALRRLDIEDERWKNAMVAIGEAVQVVGTKSYIRLYERVGDSDEYRVISLDLAGV